MAGLDLPGATPVGQDRAADMVRLLVGIALTVGGDRRDRADQPPAPAAVDGLSDLR